MQDLLTASIELTAIASLAYFSVMFVLGWNTRRIAPLEHSALLCTEDEAIAVQLSEMWTAAELNPIADVSATFVRPVFTPEPSPIADTVVPFVRPIAITEKSDSLSDNAEVAYVAAAIVPAVTVCRVSQYEGMSSKELRAECTARGIRWNRAGVGGIYLKKIEMIRALQG